MCLALPALVVERRDGDEALVDLGGVRKNVSIALVPDAAVGDYVVVHVGFAIGKIDADEAARTLALFAEMASVDGAGVAAETAGAAAAAEAAR